jgi:hypothetical protein
MARKTDSEMEEIVDKIMNNYLGGVTRPSQMMNIVKIDYKTAVKYIEIARKRIDNLIKDTNREEILKRELISLDYLEYLAWSAVYKADNINHLAGVCNTIVKIKEKRIELLDLKSIVYKIIKDEAPKEEKGEPLDFESHDWLITRMQAKEILNVHQQYKDGKRDKYGNLIHKNDKEGV